MSYAPAETAVAGLLQAAGLGTLGSTIFIGPARDAAPVPDAALFLTSSGGQLEPVLDGKDLGTVFVQVMVRSARNDNAGAYTKAGQVTNALHRATVSSPLIGITCDAPFYVEEDRSGRHLYSVNCQIMTYQ